jgi:pyridoxal 5'-phosphate synthase pdxT subunit
VGPVIGVLALQGAFASHQQRLAELGAATLQVRTPDDLTGVDALVMPGGESTTMSKLLVSSGLFDAIERRIAEGMAVFGTCAGMILLATEVLDGRADQRSFGVIDVSVRRNGYGRQVDSFEAELDVASLAGGTFHGVFIRAPKVERVGAGVEVLAEHEGVPVLARSGRVTVASFHPELANDARLHAQFLAGASQRFVEHVQHVNHSITETI